MTEQDSSIKDKKSSSVIPYIVISVIAVIAAIYFFIQSQKPPVIITKEGQVIQQEIAQFELLIPELVQDKQTLELMEEEFEYWYKVEVSRKIIKVKEGSIQDNVLKHAPKFIRDQLLDNDLNKSKANIVVKCKVSVEFEIDFSAKQDWGIKVVGDTAYIDAPAIIADDPNVPPESIESWVLEEELFIDGTEEKKLLEKTTRTRLNPYIQSEGFLAPRRERCRSNLEKYFLNLFSKFDDRTKEIKHVIIKFKGE